MLNWKTSPFVELAFHKSINDFMDKNYIGVSATSRATKFSYMTTSEDMRGASYEQQDERSPFSEKKLRDVF